MLSVKSIWQKFAMILSAVLPGAIFYFFLLILLSLVAWLSPVSEKWLEWMAVGALGIACLLAGIKAGRGCQKKGLLWGSLSAILLILLLSFSCKIVTGNHEMENLVNLKNLFCALAGSVGGMIGVNR